MVNTDVKEQNAATMLLMKDMTEFAIRMVAIMAHGVWEIMNIMDLDQILNLTPMTGLLLCLNLLPLTELRTENLNPLDESTFKME